MDKALYGVSYMGSGLIIGNAMRARARNISFPMSRPDPDAMRARSRTIKGDWDQTLLGSDVKRRDAAQFTL